MTTDERTDLVADRDGERSGRIEDRRHGIGRAVDQLTARPVLTVALIGTLVAALNVWWVATHRDLGAFNVDEVGYTAKAFGFHRTIDPSRPWVFVGSVFSPAPTGPLVPLLAVPLLLVGPRSMVTVLAVQPLIGAVAALAAAGVVNRIAGRRPAVVAGVVLLAVPAMIGSARGFQYAAALGCCMLLALWALLVSQRGTRLVPMIGFGAAVGAMLLARTMAIGLVPAMALGGLVVVGWNRKGLIGLGLAAVTALAIAGPWWYASREPLADYLFRFGYGDESGLYGTQNVFDRGVNRLLSGVGDLRVPFIALGVVVAVAAVVHLVTWVRAGRGWRASPLARRDLAALAAVVLCGYGALMTTANQGVWFELPLELVLITLTVAVGGVLGGRAMSLTGRSAIIVAACAFTVSLTDSGGPYDLRTAHGFVQGLLAGGLDDKQNVLVQADRRLDTHDVSVRSGVAEEWWNATQHVRRTVAAIEDDADQPVMVTVSGASHLMTGQSFLLAGELAGRPFPPGEVPETRAPIRELRRYLEPESDGQRRILVLMHPRSHIFAEDERVDLLGRLAVEEGWEVVETVPLPDGGRVDVLTHPDGDRA